MVSKTGNVLWKKKTESKSKKYYIFWVCVCSPRCTACNAHAPYSHLWPVGHYKFFFPNYLTNGTLEKKLLNIKNQKARSITHSEYACVASGVQLAMHMHHILICGLSDSTNFFFPNYHTNGTLEKKLPNTKNQKARSITYSEYACVAPGVQLAMHMHHILICGLSDSTNFFFPNYLTNGTNLEKKNSYWT